MMIWTREAIEALAAARGFDRLEPEHIDRWLELAQRQPSSLPLRKAVERKEDQPAYGPQAFAPTAALCLSSSGAATGPVLLRPDGLQSDRR